ncbi:acyltransferase family protein [Clostridium paraputrificum]|uniref:acyltransferase family protein n=1 Tax=Clostridium TaxID=1485 RepID=UPI003D347558
MKERDYYFDNLKAFLIISVIIGNSLEYANPTSINPHYFILILYIFHMPLFTFVSGYFCKKSTRSTQSKVIDIFKIYVGAQIFYHLLDKFFFKNYTSRLEFFSPQWTLWYLLSIIFWYILADFIKDKKKWFIFSLLLSLYIGFDNGVGSYASISRTFFFLPFFVAGMALNKENIMKLKEHKKVLIGASTIILVVLYYLSDYIPVELFFEYTKYTFYFDTPGFPFFVRVFHYLGAFTVGALILSLVPKKKTILHTLGANSLIMYITHSGITKILFKWRLIEYSSPIRVFISEGIVLFVTILVTISYIRIKGHIKEKRKHGQTTDVM